MRDLMQDGSRVPFRVKKSTLFDKLFKAYCQKKSLDQNTLVFMGSDGQRLNAHQTPAEVSLLPSTFYNTLCMLLAVQACILVVKSDSSPIWCSLTWRMETQLR